MHPGMLDYPAPIIEEEKMRNAVEEFYNEIGDINSYRDFYFTLSKFLAIFEDQHLHISKVDMEKIQVMLALPIYINWLEDSYYITDYLNIDDDTKNINFDDIVNSKIISINDIDINILEDMISKFSSKDKNNKFVVKPMISTYLLAKYTYKSLLGLDYINDSVRVKYKKTDGSYNEIELPFVDFEGKIDKIKPITKEKNDIIKNIGRNKLTKIKDTPVGYEYYQDIDTIYLQFNGSLQDEYEGETYKKLFTEAKENNVEYLIIDLRNSRGSGIYKWHEQLIGYFIKEKQELYTKYLWTRDTKTNYKNRKVQDGKSIFYPTNKDLSFDGKVIVFTSSGTACNSTYFVYPIKDNRLGIIIGEPCYNNSNRYGRCMDVTLPNSELDVCIPISYMERSAPNIKELEPIYIEPNIYIPTTIDDYLNKTDPLWDYFINNIVK